MASTKTNLRLRHSKATINCQLKFLLYKNIKNKNTFLSSGVHCDVQKLCTLFCLARITVNKLFSIKTFELSIKIHYNKVCFNFLVSWLALQKMTQLSSKLILKQKVKETVFNYCVQQSSLHDKINSLNKKLRKLSLITAFNSQVQAVKIVLLQWASYLLP